IDEIRRNVVSICVVEGPTGSIVISLKNRDITRSPRHLRRCCARTGKHRSAPCGRSAARQSPVGAETHPSRFSGRNDYGREQMRADHFETYVSHWLSIYISYHERRCG